MNDLIERCAHAMLAFEAWGREQAGKGRGQPVDPFPGPTADALIVAEVGKDIHAYVAIASPAIARATELRGCSPTAVRIKDQKSRAKSKERRRAA